MLQAQFLFPTWTHHLYRFIVYYAMLWRCFENVMSVVLLKKKKKKMICFYHIVFH